MGSAAHGRWGVSLGWGRRALILAIFLCAWLWAWPPARGTATEGGPPGDFCAQINALAPGGELVLPPGEYRGPCTIRTGGLPGRPIVVRGQTPTHRPRIAYDGRRSNVIDVKADHVTIRGLAFGPTQDNVDGIRIFGREGVTVEECEFSGLGGIAVVASHYSNHGLVVRRNIVRNSAATAMYFGCHDGAECVAEALLIEGNYIHTVRAPDPQIGYGIQIKLNSWGIVRDNVVVDTKGPAIMVYGAVDPGRASLVEGNLASGSLQSSGIVVGGGPVIVRNNIAIGNALAGVGIEDYGRRRLLRGVIVAHNTLYGNDAGPLTLTRDGSVDAAVVNNALQGKGTVAMVIPSVAGLRLEGNVNCSRAACFVNPETDDFSPLPGGPLIGAGVNRSEPWFPAFDFFGTRRRDPPSAGAVENHGRPLRVGPKY
jgi:hypothetical protein